MICESGSLHRLLRTLSLFISLFMLTLLLCISTETLLTHKVYSQAPISCLRDRKLVDQVSDDGNAAGRLIADMDRVAPREIVGEYDFALFSTTRLHENRRGSYIYIRYALL